MQQRFQKYLIASAVIHLLLMLLMWRFPAINWKDEKPYKITMIRLSKGDGGTNLQSNQKNTKNLPQSTLREQKQALKDLAKDKTGSDLRTNQSKTQKTVEQKVSQKRTSDTGGINPDKKTVPTKTPNARIDDALARIDQQLKQREVDFSAAQSKTGDTGQSPWGSDKGDVVDPQLILYYNTIKRKINKEWVVNENSFTGELHTQIIVLIDASGNVLRTDFKGLSGNGSFDDSAMRAIRRSAPFPPPPESIRKEALTEGFLIEFNPQSVTGHI